MQEQDDPRIMPVVYHIPGMEQAIVRKDITYRSVDGSDLRMDVYYPASFQSGTILPAVIFVHGDADPEFLENAKVWEVFIGWGQLTAASGLITITFNHRSSQGLTQLSDVTGDIESLVHFVRDNAESLGIDRDALGIWCCSAGTPYGLRAAMLDSPAYVRCIIACYGVMDIQAMFIDAPSETDVLVKELSGVYHVQKHPEGIAPIFVARAGLDDEDLNKTIDTFVAEALSHNIPLTLMNHPNGQHAFDILDNNARSREIIQAVLDFMKTHLL